MCCVQKRLTSLKTTIKRQKDVECHLYLQGAGPANILLQGVEKADGRISIPLYIIFIENSMTIWGFLFVDLAIVFSNQKRKEEPYSTHFA